MTESHIPPSHIEFGEQELQHWLAMLRDGSPDEQVGARNALARICERRGLISEACDLLETNAEKGYLRPELFRRLARLYRKRGMDSYADEALALSIRFAETREPRPVNGESSPQTQPVTAREHRLKPDEIIRTPLRRVSLSSAVSDEPNSSILSRGLRALIFDRHVFAEVAADSARWSRSWVVVFAAGFAYSLGIAIRGFLGHPGETFVATGSTLGNWPYALGGLVGGTAMAIIWWMLSSWVMWLLGTRAVGGSRVPFGAVRASFAYTMIPHFLGVGAAVWFLSDIVQGIAQLWTLALTVAATHQALGLGILKSILLLVAALCMSCGVVLAVIVVGIMFGLRLS